MYLIPDVCRFSVQCIYILYYIVARSDLYKCSAFFHGILILDDFIYDVRALYLERLIRDFLSVAWLRCRGLI